MGAVFGEVAVLIRCERAHSVRASAEGAARLAVIDRELFRSINEHCPVDRRAPRPIECINICAALDKSAHARVGVLAARPVPIVQ